MKLENLLETLTAETKYQIKLVNQDCEVVSTSCVTKLGIYSMIDEDTAKLLNSQVSAIEVENDVLIITIQVNA